MLISYLKQYLEDWGGLDRIAPSRAYLDSLDEMFKILNTVHQANIANATEIKVIWSQAKLLTLQEVLRKEEAWSHKVTELHIAQGMIQDKHEIAGPEIEKTGKCLL